MDTVKSTRTGHRTGGAPLFMFFYRWDPADIARC